MKDFFTRNIPAVTMTEVEGSFVIWIDWRRLKLDDEELYSFLLNEAYLDLDKGVKLWRRW
jgi:cystathionine beta-lyase